MSILVFGSAGPAGAATRTIVDPTGRCQGTFTRQVDVSTAVGLSRALRNAQPGDYIHLADGRYVGQFALRVSGTSAQRIVVCGSRQAILSGASLATGYGLYIRASHVTVAGITVTHSLKGIMLDRANYVLLRGLAVYGIGDEGIHFRTFSRYDVLELSAVHHTGLLHPKFGEGVYVGSAKSNWTAYTGGRPDQTNYNVVRNNAIGPKTTAESIDIKEGTTGTQIVGNTFSGTGMNRLLGADSWVDIKGSRTIVIGNVGTTAPLDGFQVHLAVAGWGRGTVFAGNIAHLSSAGYGFRIGAGVAATSIRCDNVVTGARSGSSNIHCTP